MKALLCSAVIQLSLGCTGYSATDELAATLPEKPCGIGRPAADRAWWGPLAKSPEGVKAVKAAESCLKQTMPAFDRERYLDYTTNGDRSRYQATHSRRWDRFKRLALGECLDGNGRFVPAIEETVRNLCSDPSWILPAHDRGAEVLNGAPPYADLAVASSGHEMALAAWLLEDRLSPATLALMRENVARRLTQPVFQTIDGTAPENVKRGHWWARTTNNWNAVCTAGALGAILATEPSREKRASAIRWAEANTATFLTGFAADGYCTEGIGYWNYGFGHFVVLAELLRDQTGGTVDLYRKPGVRAVAAAPAMLELTGGVMPAFADCALDAKPDATLMEALHVRLSAHAASQPAPRVLRNQGYLYQIPLYTAMLAGSGETTAKPPLPAHSWFPESGVYIGRPSSPLGMAVAWKGGHNAEHHNHNDVGTTIAAWKGRPIILDPGAMTYRAETFSKDRYRLPVMSSFGHSVPVVDGMLQSPGASCRGVVPKAEFSPTRDTMIADLTAAYPKAPLKSLERSWTHGRADSGTLTIEDRFSLTKPGKFATALVGIGSWHLSESSGRKAVFYIDAGDGAVLRVDAEFSAKGSWTVEKIDNPGKPTVFRLNLALASPATEGFIRATIRPAPEGVPKPSEKLPSVDIPGKLADESRAP